MSGIESLFAELDRLRQGYRRMVGLAGAVVLLAIWALVSVVFIGADLLLRFPAWVCWCGFLVLMGCLTGALVLIVRALRKPMSRESLALRTEDVAADLGNRLINTVQFATSAQEEDRSFAGSLLVEQPVELKTLAATSLFPRSWLKRPVWAAVAGVVLSAGLYLATPEGYLTSAKRLLMPFAGIPPYTLTRFASLEPGETALVKGNALTVNVQFGGVLPSKAYVELQVNGRDVKSLPMLAAEEAKGAFRLQTPQLFAAAQYRVLGGDARSPWFDVRVENLPSLERWEADVRPPAYCNAPMFRLRSGDTAREVPIGSTVTLSGVASHELQRVAMLQDGKVQGQAPVEDGRKFRVTAVLSRIEEPLVLLVAKSGIQAKVAFPVPMAPDQSPVVAFTNLERRMKVSADKALPIEFMAEDDHGIREVRLIRIESSKTQSVLSVAKPQNKGHKRFPGRFLLDIPGMRLAPGKAVRLRLAAADYGPAADSRLGLSQTIELVIASDKEERKAEKELAMSVMKILSDMIQLQQQNLTDSRKWQLEGGKKKDVPLKERAVLLERQRKIQTMAVELLTKNGSILGDLRATIANLTRIEIPQAVGALETVHRSPPGELVTSFQKAIILETRILAVLKGLPIALKFERNFQTKADLLERFQKIVSIQWKNVGDSKKAQKEKWGKAQTDGLADTQGALADRLSTFMRDARRQATLTKDDLARQLKEVTDELAKEQIYEKMLTASEQLEERELAAAIPTEEAVLKVLKRLMSKINQWRVKKARDTIAKAKKMVKEMKSTLDEMEKDQSAIADATKDLLSREEVNEELKKELAKLDEKQEEMKQKIDKLVQDLYQFPELPVANELNSKMREVYEDVEQAAGSENEPVKEIAVQKEDSLLEAIKKAKERVEDVEMWLPDKPDNVKWDMETFDSAEFPDMPLVPLPDELEDLVGELLDQAAEIDEASQDSTGNNMMADAEMGWGVADGPMPSFAAKGKSGNTKPNDNEMTGRSGAGREGQSNGELVEDHVKGLEGRDTHARRTDDPMQKGQVTEDEDSTMTANATGGGKLGGESESIGMFGNAPRRDLQMQPSEKMKALRQETEALYATSRMLFMGNTGNIGAAAGELRTVERVDKNLRDISINRRVMRRLSDASAEVSSGAVLNMPVSGGQMTGGSAGADDMDLDQIDEKYRGMLSDYYKNLDE